MGRICDHLPRRTCFETPPSEVAKHVEMRLVFPLLRAHKQLQIQIQLYQ